MYLRKSTLTFTEDCSDRITRLRYELETADSILIGAGAGMSESAGLFYRGERFYRYFSDFHEKYGITDMYLGGFYPFASPEEYWAWWSRQIYVNRYEAEAGKPYTQLLKLVKDKNYFVITTNVDHQFQKAGFDKKRLFYTQGDYGLWQCVCGCGGMTFDNERRVRRMVREQKEMRIPSELVPKCPFCGKPMTMNLRTDGGFVQDSGWYSAAERYKAFTEGNGGGHMLLLELGVGMNTPGIIKYPFLRMAAENPLATYCRVNKCTSSIPGDLRGRGICIDEDIGEVLERI